MKQRLPVALSSLALLAAFALPAHASANLVVNGSFEDGGVSDTFTGWTADIPDGLSFPDYGPTGTAAHDSSDGLWSAYFGSASSSPATLSQSLATTTGTTYVLSFDVANDNAGGTASNQLLVTVGGRQLYAATDLADQGYVHETFEFTASTAPTSISFAAYNDTGYLQLDNVSVTAAPVPEPSSVALMFGGLLAMGGLAIARRRGR